MMSETEDRPVLAVRLDDLFRTVRPKGRHWTNAEVAEELKRVNPELRVGGVYLSQLRTGKRSNPSPDLRCGRQGSARWRCGPPG